MATERDEGRLPSRADGSDEPVEGSAIGRPAVPRPSDPVRRAIVLTPIAAIVVGIIVVIANLPDGRAVTPGDGSPSIPTGAPAVESRGYLVSVDELRPRKDLAEAGEEPYASAVADLFEWADGALDEDPEPIQPLIVVGTDNAFVDDARRAYGLGLAYVLSGEERYAAASRRTIRAWVDTATTTADTCHDHGGCHTSLILGRAGAGFAFGADLIEESESWTETDTADLRLWMGEVLLPAASERINNWGDAGTFLRVVAADYAGNQPEFERAIAKWRALIDLIGPDGRIPEETRRGSAGILYTQEALQYKLAVARIAERRGIDLWSYVGAGGGSLRSAVDYLADYWHRPEDWPDHPRPRTPAVGPMWELAYAQWGDSRWVPIMLDRRPYGNFGHSAIAWTTLTNGVPIEETGVAGASPSPGASFASDVPATPAGAASPTPSSAAAGAPITGLAVRLGSPLAAGVAVAVRWDPPPAPGAIVELERAVDGGDWEPFPIGPDENAAGDSLRPGAVHAYRVRVAGPGAPGPWATVGEVAVGRLEATSRTVRVDGSWERVAFGAYSGGSALSTDDNGATLTWQGTAQAISIVGPTGPTRGRMIVTVDGTRADVVDLGSARFVARQVLFTVSWPEAAVHEITIEAEPIGGRRTVAVDDIVTLGSTVNALAGS
jgi:hypothetical protein